MPELGTNANIGKFKRAGANSAFAELIRKDVTELDKYLNC